MAKWTNFVLTATMLTLCAAVTSASERVTNGRVHFLLGGEEPRLMIVLGSNPAVLEPVPTATDLQAMASYRARMMQYADWPHDNIEIRIPLPEYGSTASFDDAYISRNEGTSFDAGYYAATNDIKYAGTVTITEFTRDVLAGEYSATLHTTYKPKEPRFVENVSGWFRISSPGSNDSRVNNELSEGERVRLNASAVWQTLNGVGLGLDDAETFANAGGTVQSVTPSRTPKCVCECDVLIRLPENHNCIQPEGDCHLALKMCREQGLDKVTGPSSADVEEILDHTLGKNAPETTRSAMRTSIEQMPAEERAELLEGLRQGLAQTPGSQPDLPPNLEQIQSALDSPETVTNMGAVPVNPDWDAETLRYKAAVEKLGLPPDFVEEAIEMFHSNEAPMRQTLWKNVEEQLARKQQRQ